MLKGKTIIELTNVNTGKKETYEDHNMVTQAINEIILKRKKYLYPSDSGTGSSSESESSFYNMFPLYKRFFGGLMLFQGTIDESRMFLSGDDVVIGSATYGNAYSGLDPQVGSYNQTESEINTTEKYAKLVYDFATNQGNGTISSVCLGNYHYVYHALYGKTYNGDVYSRALENLLYSYNTTGGSYSGPSSLPSMCLFPTMRNTGNFNANDGYETPVVYDEEKGHLITVQFTSSLGTPSYNNVIDVIKLKIYDSGLNKVTLFGGYVGDYYKGVETSLIYEKDFTIPTTGNYSQYNMQTNWCKFAYYDKAEDCIYVLGDSKNTNAERWNANDIFTMFKFNLNVVSYENIEMQTIEITNKTGKTLYVATTWKSQMTSYKKILIHNGYLYAPVYPGGSSYVNEVAKIKITDSTDVTVIGGMQYSGSPCLALGDMVYFGLSCPSSANSNFRVKVLNTKTNEMKYTRLNYAPENHSGKGVPIKGNDFYELALCGTNPSSASSSSYLEWRGAFRSRNDYFATINNLDTPVTKTSDKTMKITYVLQGE